VENRRLRRRDACLSRAGIELARHRAARPAGPRQLRRRRHHRHRRLPGQPA